MKLYLQLKWDGLPENYLNDYAVNLDKVTEADVLRLAKQYYKPENFSILLCGPAGSLQEEVCLQA
jgi:predicted Zn-dependent peptidase